MCDAYRTPLDEHRLPKNQETKRGCLVDQRKSTRTWLLLVSALVLLLFLFVSRMEYAPFQRQVPLKPYAARFVDETGSLARTVPGELNAYLHWTYVGYGVDMRYLIIKSTGSQSLEDYAVDKARALGVGSTTGERGILCVYDTTDQRMRIEVGPKLEGVLTDAFISYLERENTHAYVSNADLGLGLKLTLELIVRRLQEAELGEDYDPRPGEHILNNHLLAEGAGATAVVGANGVGDGLINRAAPPEIMRKYAAQPTVEEAWQKYIEWESEPYEYVDVPLLTPDTRDFLRHQPMSRAFFDYIAMGDYGQPHVERRHGDVAMLVFTRSPFISPYYFRHAPDGWQMDIVGSIHNSYELLGNVFTWEWKDGHDDYSRAFSDQVIVIDNVYRIVGSDNRTLPVHIPGPQ